MARTIVEAFNELRSRLALTDAQTTTARGHVDSIASFCRAQFTLASDGVYVAGSFARNTMVRWTRDVDVMLTLSVPKYHPTYGDDSSKFLYMVRDALNERFASTTVGSKRVAVKLDFSDVVADVVPSFRREGGGYLMPDGTGGWRSTNPPFHTDLMRAANIAKGQRLKPLVQLMKAWNIANDAHLGSIHVELIVERMWQRTSAIPSPYPAALAATLEAMPGWVSEAFPDPWAPGRNVDAELSREDRGAAMTMLRQDAATSAQAEEDRLSGRTQSAFAKWDSVFRHKFPANG